MKFTADNFVFSGGFEVFFSDKLINRRIVRESDLGYPGALGKI